MDLEIEMTHRQVWEYVKQRSEDSELGSTYSRELFKKLNDIKVDYLVNEDALAAFEAELECRGKEMVSKPRNQQFPIKLPGGFALLAVAYGTGKDDYLAMVLGFDAGRGKLVTWIANFDVGPQSNDEVACGGGNYFDYRDGENDAAASEAWQREKAKGALEDVDGVVVKARRDETLARAWVDFFVRATDLMRKAVHWGIGGN